MRDFTRERQETTPDEVWLVQHPPVFTLGLAGKREHLIAPSSIPLVQVDRGGQITYHGPGQIVLYLLLDLRRHHLSVKRLVTLMEQSLIDLLATQGISAERQAGAPGVYVQGEKIAALGLRVQKGCCYHGLSLNVDMDLAPFQFINPCGYAGLAVTRTADLGIEVPLETLERSLVEHLATHIGASPVFS
ncbi:MAG: lipoyl(octanoyl) transferase LipB [Betaproteobacteria bacterium]|nr:lipoyl(octanoyl) transferase LipB [Betaproteobacteria bacterium]MDE2132189.1 lipoyl(octanoyl) transferase LipB [Betaproteobacteria bacterium]MDE2211253.1 lipoyl(octanoyl) transferase LipB [Betaproteobacteria bacterium]MDE2353509.1 lipoyl(octanoyl) transferase LipB [Betaproteobacteria bacterium]